MCMYVCVCGCMCVLVGVNIFLKVSSLTLDSSATDLFVVMYVCMYEYDMLGMDDRMTIRGERRRRTKQFVRRDDIWSVGNEDNAPTHQMMDSYGDCDICD